MLPKLAQNHLNYLVPAFLNINKRIMAVRFVNFRKFPTLERVNKNRAFSENSEVGTASDDRGNCKACQHLEVFFMSNLLGLFREQQETPTKTRKQHPIGSMGVTYIDPININHSWIGIHLPFRPRNPSCGNTVGTHVKNPRNPVRTWSSDKLKPGSA